VLDPHGRNTLALAMTSDGGAGNGLEPVALTNLGTVRGGVPLVLDDSPGYRPPAIRLTGANSGVLATVSVPPDALGTELRATVDWGHALTTTEPLDPAMTITGAQPGRQPRRITLSDAVDGTVLASTRR
jgi:hypothetical protein